MSDQLLSTDPAAGLGAAAPAPRMNFAIVNGQRVPIDDAPETPAGPRLLSADPKAGIVPEATPVDDGKDEGITGFLSHYWKNINPAQAGQLLPFPKALGGSGGDHPLAVDLSGKDGYAPNFLVHMRDVRRKGDEAWAKGDHVGAAAHYLYSILPLIGPALDAAGDEFRSGKVAAALGDTLGLSTSLFAPEVLAGRGAVRPGGGTLKPPAAPGGGGLTAAEAASNAFGAARGIPTDAALATGNRFVRGVQKAAGESLVGSFVGEKAVGAQTAALKRVGGELAEEARPGAAVSPEQGGAGVHQSITDTVQSLRSSTNDAYGRVREIEADPANAETVQTAKLGTSGYRRILDKLSQGWRDETGGKVIAKPTHPELYTMRQIEQELDAQHYQKGKLVNDSFDQTEQHYARGASNADVYHDIQQAAGTSSMTGAEMRAGIAETLETGEWNAASKAAYRVAQKRVQAAAGGVGRGPRLADDAPILGRAESVALPVDVSPAQDAVAPIHARLAEANKLAPLMGDQATAYRALDRLVNGPSQVPLSVAEDARGALLKLSRSDDPLFRSAGQGIASKAAAELDAAIQEKAATVPEVQQRLEAGRGATRTKHEIGDVWDKLPEEPVRAFDKLTASHDVNINLLREIQKISPEKMPELGRAKLQQWLDLATERGRFDHADKLYAEWEKLGPQTKRILFEDPKLVEALDNFFLLAKRLHENPNPSGSATTYIKVGEAVGLVTHPLDTLPGTVTLAVLAKLLYSQKGAEALSSFMKASAKPAAVAGRAGSKVAAATASSATRAAALSRLALVAKGEGIDLGLAADRDETR